MPLEYYLGAVAVVIVLVLLVVALRGGRPARRVIRQNSKGIKEDEQTIQLKRIADALEAIAAQLQAPSPTLRVSAAPEKSSEGPGPTPTLAEHETAEEPAKHRYVNLSMFGR